MTEAVVTQQQELAGKYRPYSEYKDSGVEWLGIIPSEWQKMPLKRYCKVVSGYAFPSEMFIDSGLPVVRIGDIKSDGSVVLDDCKYIEEQNSHLYSRFAINSGELLMAMTGATIGKAGWFQSDTRAFLNQRVGSFRASDSLEYKFLWYVLSSSGYQEYIQLTAFGGAQPNISDTGMLAYETALPSIQEQRTIAAFLDYETARIDRLIAKQQRLIELLKEKRQAVISHAVTKGLNPNTPMKDSGVEWLGQVPEHWAVGRYKFCNSRIIVGIAEAATHAYVDHGVPLIRSTNIKESGLDCSDVLYLNPVFAAQNITKKLRARDIVTVRTGYPGISAVVPLEFDNSQCFTNLVATPLPQHESDFLCEYLNSAVGKSYFELNAWGSAQKNISVPILQDFPVAWPSQVEEVEIVSFCKKNNEKYNKLIDTATKGIELLQERRTALISAAVTGKIDLRGWTPPADEVAV